MTKTTISGTSRTRRKAFAIGAAALVLASGAVVTSLAATGWSDEEWVNGGIAGNAGLTASIFNVNQNVTASTTTGWGDFPSTPGNTMSFSVPTAGISPGQTAFAFVRLRTVVGSLGGDLLLSKADMAAGGSSALFSALRYQATLMASSSTCNATDFGTGTFLVGSAAAQTLDQAAASTFALVSATSTLPGAEQTVCFAVSLPFPQPTTLQGTATTPIWHFTANSN